MAGQVNIGGTTASVQLTGNDDITQNQEVLFPDTAGAPATVVVSPGTADIETTGDLEVGSITAGDLEVGSITAAGKIQTGDADDNGRLTGNGSVQSRRTGSGDDFFVGLLNGTQKFSVKAGGNLRLGGDIVAGTESISLMGTDGSITAAGSITTNNQLAVVDTSAGNYFLCKPGTTNTNVAIKTNADMALGGTNAASGNDVDATDALIKLRGSDGSATFEGTVKTKGGTVSPAIIIQTEFENSDAWETQTEEVTETIEVEVPVVKKPGVGTADLVDGDERETRTVSKEVTRTVETQVYVGKTLDVRQTLESLLSRAEQQDAVIADLTRQLTELKGAN